VRNIAMAWVLTLPAATVLSGVLYWIFATLFYWIFATLFA